MSDSEELSTGAATPTTLSDESAAEDTYDDKPARKPKKSALKRNAGKGEAKKTQAANQRSGSAQEDNEEAYELDDEQGDWMDQGEYDDDEEQEEREQKRLYTLSIRAEEAELKKKVRRKLTNGERNYIRLCRVSQSWVAS